nr:NAD kinase 2, mitochondrial [Halyomorpha halys]
MKCLRLLKKNLNTGWYREHNYCNANKFTFKRVLIINKRTRYELERALCPGITKDQLEQIIKKRGSDFDRILLRHHQHNDFYERIACCFKNHGVEVETVNRTSYSEKEVEWADLIVIAGGDGTFLLGASLIRDQNKPIVGFNTNPGCSEGYLCLPKKYSFDVDTAVKKILKNDFDWLLRNRIEVEVLGPNALDEVFILDSTKKSWCVINYYYFNFFNLIRLCSINKYHQPINHLPWKTKLPKSSFDMSAKIGQEIFMGENVSSQTSSLLIHPEGYDKTIVKCSGLCISTGTGSTSWHMSINRLTEEKVRMVMELSGHPPNDEDEVACITKKYNKSLRFSPDDRRLYWSLREPIYSSVFPDPPGFPAGGFSKRVSVGSRCFSGCLVVDGTHWYPFHDGTVAQLYSSADKCLRTISFN